MPVVFIILVLGAILIFGGIKDYSIKDLLIGRIVPRNTSENSGINPGDPNSVYTGDSGTQAGNPSKQTGKSLGSGILNSVGKILGTPYVGTHSKEINVRGGSDNWQSENAVDIAEPIGTKVYAPVSGTIVRAGYLPGNPGGRFAGQRVTIQGSDNAFYFAHLSSVAVKVGQQVSAGTILGDTGEANGVAHLHFAVENGSPLDWIMGSHG